MRQKEDFLGDHGCSRKVGYDSAFTFIYSKEAEHLQQPRDQVPEEVVKDRFGPSFSAGAGNCTRTFLPFEGTVQEVLVESVNDQDASLVTGRMGNNLLVHFRGMLL